MKERLKVEQPHFFFFDEYLTLCPAHYLVANVRVFTPIIKYLAFSLKILLFVLASYLERGWSK